MHKAIQDNVYKNIDIDEDIIWELIGTKEFQRLRRIVQLGSSEFVYPSAKHVRFNHCIGTYNAVKLFLKVDDINNVLTDDEKLYLKIAGLLHDIGHGPFSHLWEVISPIEHEKYTTLIIRSSESNVNKILIKNNIDPEIVCQIIEGKHKNKLLCEIISSQFDADRFDYLMRDAINLGLGYTSLDLHYLLKCIRVVDNHIVFENKALSSIEEYLLGRFFMYRQVYHHRLSISFGESLNFLFTRIRDLIKQDYKFRSTILFNKLDFVIKNKVATYSEFTDLDDCTMWEFFKELTHEKDFVLKDIAERLLNRKYHKLSIHMSKSEYEQRKKEFGKNSKYYFAEKTYFQKTIYTEDKQPIMLIDKNNKIYNLSELSEMIKGEANKKEFKGYIFVD